MKGYGVELRVSDLQMNAWTWRVYDTVKARRGMVEVCTLMAQCKLKTIQ